MTSFIVSFFSNDVCLNYNSHSICMKKDRTVLLHNKPNFSLDSTANSSNLHLSNICTLHEYAAIIYSGILYSR